MMAVRRKGYGGETALSQAEVATLLAMPAVLWRQLPFTGNAVALEQATPAMKLAGSASAFSEWLATSPYAGEVTPDQLLGYLRGVPEVYGADARPKALEWMIRQAKSLAGK